ncbi:MAG TPA: hypothetical protein PKB06_08930, partial [Actinotalea sp.]|nr:hypothetical protein [Actinotalea sp.]
RRAHDAVLQIASTGRSALVAMQSALGSIGPEDGVAGHGDGVAGHDDGVPGHRTTPTEIDLPTLVDRFRAAGVQVRVDGLEAELPDDTSLRLAVLRILGESLTNVLRHGQVSAGPTPAGGWRVHARLPVRVEQGGGR